MVSALVFTACGNDNTTEADSSTTSTISSDSMANADGFSNMGADTGMNTHYMSGTNGAAPDITGTNVPCKPSNKKMSPQHLRRRFLCAHINS